jgi:hypothetical protein
MRIGRDFNVTIDSRSDPSLHDVRYHAPAHQADCPVTGAECLFYGRAFSLDAIVARDDDRAPTIPAGGARRDRTDDLLLAKQALSQLSYGPGPERTHPVDRNPGRGRAWWAWEDLNFRPHAYQARALTN